LQNPLRGWTNIREELPAGYRLALGLIPILGLILLWLAATSGTAEARWISPVILPSPGEVIGSFRSLWFEAEFSLSAIASLRRVALGFVLGSALAFPIGVAMGSFSRVKALLEPATLFLAYTPIPALVPLTMSLFGVDELQKVVFLALAFFIYLTPLIVRAVDEVDNVFLQTAYTMGANGWQAIRRVLLPIALPQIIHAMRLGFGVGWTYIILVEMVAAERGLGQIIIIAQRRGPREHIYLVLLAIVAIAYLTDKGWAKLSRSLFPYLNRR
jgi:NitT/TauT family transport system permease protein